MNPHIIIEEHPHSLRHLIMSYVFCGGIFFLIGVGGRPIIDYTWARWMDIPQVTVACVPESKPTMHWGKQK
jgi:hypothetical protein